jgi:hypothetical protein
VAATLTPAQQADAVHQGMLPESGAFAGEAAKMADTLAGAESAAAAARNETAVSFGAALAPALKAGTALYAGLLDVVKGLIAASPEATAGLTGAAGAMALFVAASAGLKTVAAHWSAVTALFSGPVGWVALGIGALVGGITALVSASERAKEALREQAEALDRQASQAESEAASIAALGREYETLAQKTGKTVAEKDRMLAIESELERGYGIAVTGLDGEKQGYEALAAAIQETTNQRRIDAAVASEQAARIHLDTATSEGKSRFAGGALDVQARYEAQKENLQFWRNELEAARLNLASEELIAGIEAELATQAAVVAQTAAELGEAMAGAFGPAIDEGWNLISAKLTQAMPALSDDLRGAMEGMYRDIAAADLAAGATGALGESFVDAVAAQFASLNLAPVEAELSGMIQATLERGGTAKDAIAAYAKNITSELAKADFAATGGVDAERLQAVYDGLVESLNKTYGGATLAADGMVRLKTATEGAAEAASAATGEAQADPLAAVKAGYEQAKEGARGLLETTLEQRKALDDNLAALQVLQNAEKYGAAEKEAAQARLIEAYGAGAAQDLEWTQFEIEQDAALNDQRLRNAENVLLARQKTLQAKYDELAADLLITENEEERNAILLQQQQTSQEIAENWRALQSQRIDIDGMDETAREAKAAAGDLEKLQKRGEELANKRSASKAMLDLANQTKAAGKALQNADPKLKAWAQAYAKSSGQAVASVDDVIAILGKEGDVLDAETSAMEADLTGLLAYWYGVRGGIEPGINGKLTAEGSQLMAEANSAIAILEKLLSLLGVTGGVGDGTSARRGGGGGGGGGAQDAAREAEAARRAQEEAWQKALDAQLRYLDHKKRLNEISTREEIAELERIMKKYAKTAEQKIQMEEKIFEARAKLRDEEISQIDRLNDGILTALRGRYEAQRRIEEERLDASIEAWRTWADESTKAIQAQIDALDELSKAEDRDAQEAEKLRKLEATRQMITFTTDEANLEQLRKELERLEADYASWQRKNAIADQKELLRKEQEAIQERAQAEQDALTEQKDELAKVYEERLKDASLRAEAERMLMRDSQDDILALIADYAPDYEATGKTLGERLYKGFQSVAGNISTWFDKLTSGIQALQSQAAQSALAASDAYYSARQAGQAGGGAAASDGAPVTVNNTNNFNVPVETPGDTARKIQQANEALAAMI